MARGSLREGDNNKREQAGKRDGRKSDWSCHLTVLVVKQYYIIIATSIKKVVVVLDIKKAMKMATPY